MRECLRVLKPGGHALVWSIPRTEHWTACAIEDAGFEIRDGIYHLCAQGWPKSLDVSKAIDAADVTFSALGVGATIGGAVVFRRAGGADDNADPLLALVALYAAKRSGLLDAIDSLRGSPMGRRR
jgi:hypothetical protein